MSKNTLTALGLILGSAFLTPANAVQPECLRHCLDALNKCSNGCNSPNVPSNCMMVCAESTESCWSGCGLSPYAASIPSTSQPEKAK